MQATPAHGGGLIFLPTRKSHQRSVPPSPFLILPHQLRSSALSKRPILHPLYLCRSDRWNSNAETFRTRNFKLKEEDEEEAGEGGGGFSEPVDELVDSIWILKIFKAYGWFFPPIAASLLLATGPKAFLVALALPIGQSVFMFALQKLWGTAQNDLGRKNKKRPQRPQRRSPTININAGRRARKRSTRKSDVFSSRIDQDESAFGGWDELEQGKDYYMSGSSMGSPQPRTSIENGKLSRSTERGESTPLLLRLLVSIFPFLSSWSKKL
ncbi:unnamed protein product [Cuscuta epithymum]|uniref:Uncharacterized protein n=2 Tax=Cuscuta epithymum TaxID=186058 RepID=A0AAV0CRF0_9ASTE|nr:unnamed protein product [Cuscuta epithymum]